MPHARWVPAEQLHLTLRFIGEVDGVVAEDIKNALEPVDYDSFKLELKDLGCFPLRKSPQVLWAGIEKSDELVALRKKIESCLVRVGLPPDSRKFSPHITLARIRKTPLKRVTDFLKDHALFHLPEFTVDRFYLFSSVLTLKGALHYQEAEYLLNAN